MDGRIDGRIDGLPGYSTDYPYAYSYANPYLNPYLDGPGEEYAPVPESAAETGTVTGTGRHRAPTQFFSGPLIPPDSAWDPAEELAFMLQDAMARQQWPGMTDPRDEFHQVPQSRPAAENIPPEAPEAEGPAAEEAQQTPQTPSAAPAAPAEPASPPPQLATPAASPLANLQAITEELPPLARGSRGHRKIRERKRPNTIRTASRVLAAAAAVTASSVSFFGGMVAYEPLRVVAVARMDEGIASWWPLLVYGPWLVASLSVLRAALHRRRAVHSWCVVLLFSSIATLLCVIQAPRTIVDMAAATLPGLASLACFQQLVRQITLTRPPRRRAPRHRVRRTQPPEPKAQTVPRTAARSSAKPQSPTPSPSPAPSPAPAG
ncbi:DUF2637 domain-containing protein [Streptomyces sp. NPDC014748]|uniref:DUF2637 domain-containing protein n=1 Tax=Streptomyces sp. NPDC014748 TaxID=3364905 RepID=UPI0036FE57E2